MSMAALRQRRHEGMPFRGRLSPAPPEIAAPPDAAMAAPEAPENPGPHRVYVWGVCRYSPAKSPGEVKWEISGGTRRIR